MNNFNELFSNSILNVKHSDLILNKAKVLEEISYFLKIKKIKSQDSTTKSFFGNTESQWQIRQKVSKKFLNRYSEDYYILDKYLKKYEWLN